MIKRASIIGLVSVFCFCKDIAVEDEQVQLRRARSNIPCGNSFTPCNRRPSAGFDRTGPIEGPSPSQAPAIRHQMLLLAAQEAKADVDTVFNQTEPFILQNIDFGKHLSDANQYLSLYRKSDKYAKDLSYSALVSIATSQRLKRFGLRSDEIVYGLPRTSIKNTVLEKICPVNLIGQCTASRYRTFSGHCNNVQRPLWGAAYEPMQRYLAADYADEVSVPRVAVDGRELPGARSLSNQLFSEPRSPHPVCSMMLAQWAHFIYVDIVHIAGVKAFFGKESAELPCCEPKLDLHPECMPIAVSKEDRAYGGFLSCLPYSRSSPSPREKCLLGPREQANFATSYLDASAIYGSTTDKAQQLRSFAQGRLAVSSLSFLRDLPPPMPFDRSTCASSSAQPCFETGSEHINFLPSLTALHTLWLREHNRLADQLLHINPHWDDERTFQEARKIVIAQLQHITYSEFLPLLVGKENMQNFGLSGQSNGYDSAYDLSVDASALNTFAAGGVGLFFFSSFGKHIAQYTKTASRSLERPLSDYYFDPSTLYFQGRLDGIIRYLLKEPMHKPGMHMSRELRDRLFKGAGSFGQDMAALIIQMGRDHGIPSYTAWRSQCGLSRPSSFDSLKDQISDLALLDRLTRLYKSVDDADLFVLGLAEKPLKGALLGPTFACILSKQFQKTKRGDRFWYENFFYPSAFTEDQLNEIRKVTMARIICENTDDLGKIQPQVFALQDNFGNCPIDCNTTIIDRMEMNYWLDSEPKLKLPVTRRTLEKAVQLGSRQARRLRHTEQTNIRFRGEEREQEQDALFSHGTLLRAKKESLDIARTAAVLLETTKVLVSGDELEGVPRAGLDRETLQRLLPEVDVSQIIGNLSETDSEECVPKPLPCDHTSAYRTFSGWCNNLRFPEYGNAFTPLRRLLDPLYDDGFDEPRSIGLNKRALPSTRAVSNAIHSGRNIQHVKYTHMVMQFGQFLDHDMTLSPMTRGADGRVLNCTGCDSRDTLSINCYPIRIPFGDPFFPPTESNGRPRCIPFTRSLLGQLKLGYRNQLNQLTAFIDASNVYGSTECQANELRLFSMGRLNYTDFGSNAREALPQGDQERDCRSEPSFPCFKAGDERNNEHPSLAVMHTVFLREHNRMAQRLHRINNFWPDEKIYQETRRILGAVMQHIVYKEFLPKVLGCETAARYDLLPKQTGYYTGYDPRCDPSISHGFSVAAFRFGHTLIRSQFPRMDDFYHNFSRPLALADSFNNATPLYDHSSGGLDTLLVGLLGSPSMDFDRHVTGAVRNKLFMRSGQPFSGMDLAAINMQRARDHGLPPYNKYRELCGLRRAQTFDDLTDTTSDDAINAFKSIYDDVEDVDLFPGLMSERPMAGALVGPTTACIIAEQFQRLKRCDRFYYENNLPETKFTPDQLAEIRKISLSKIICSNSPFVRKIQPYVFDMPDDLINAQVSCQDLSEVDLYEWLDRQFCVVDHRVINLGKTKRITPCVACTCTAEGPECHAIAINNCHKLVSEYLFAEIMQDTVCIIQCASLIKERAGRL